MFQKFRENQNQLLALLVFVICILSITIYADITLKKHSRKYLEQQLYQIGKSYEYEIGKELEKYKSLGELLATSFSDQVEKEGFILNSEKLLSNILSNHLRISEINLVLKLDNKNQKRDLLSVSDSIYFKQTNLFKNEEGKIIVDYNDKSPELSIKTEVEEVVLKEQTKVLSPVLKRIAGSDKVVIPIIASIFEGKRYIGHLLFYVKLDWPEENQQFELEYNAYVSASSGKLISVKDNSLFLSEHIKKVCFPCNDLLNETGRYFNTSFENDYLTVCFTTNFENTINQWGICLRSDNNYSDLWFFNRLIIWTICILLLATGSILLIYLYKNSAKPWTSVMQMVTNLIRGRFNENDFNEIKNENFNKIKDTIAILNDSLNTISEHNKLAVSGNFKAEPQNKGFKHSIVNSSNSLYKHLEDTSNRLIKSSEETSQIKKFTDNLEEISKVLKLHHKDVITLSEQVIKSIVDLMDIAMGAVFLAKQKDDETILESVTSYAYHESKYIKKVFKLGDSLVGACAAEKRTVHLTKIPEDYLKILSGLGETSPKSLLIIPLIFEEEVLGVIELGSFDDFDEDSIHFAESASMNIASTLSLAQNNIRNSALLEQTRKQTKELEEQERKMKEALNELKELQAKTAKSEADVRSKLEAMNNTLLIVEYTTEGILLDANYKFLNTMHYSLDEIKGNNVIELLKEEDREELQKVINMVKSGNFYESIMRRHTKQGQEKWFMASYTPVFSDEGIVQSILFFGIDITRIKSNEEKLKIQISEMTNEIEKLKKQM